MGGRVLPIEESKSRKFDYFQSRCPATHYLYCKKVNINRIQVEYTLFSVIQEANQRNATLCLRRRSVCRDIRKNQPCIEEVPLR